MKTIRIHICRLAALLLLTTLTGYLNPARAAGPLTPPGPPAPTGKSLQEIEPRILIASVPYTISASGSYYLSNTLAVASGTAITIQANGVTLDLNGCTLSSGAASAAGYAIDINGSYSDISIFNGHIVSGVVQGSGTYSGPGFGYGIYGPSAYDVRVSDVSVSGVLYDAIGLSGNSSVVQGCLVYTAGSYGIEANIVKSSLAIGCGSIGIVADEISDSYGESPIAGGTGIACTAAVNCTGVSDASTGYGDGISADDAENCYGYSYNNDGIDASTVNNSYGCNDYLCRSGQ